MILAFERLISYQEICIEKLEMAILEEEAEIQTTAFTRRRFHNLPVSFTARARQKLEAKRETERKLNQPKRRHK